MIFPEPEKGRYTIVLSPKVGSTSVAAWIYKQATGDTWSEKKIGLQAYLQHRGMMLTRALSDDDCAKRPRLLVAIHRDPAERLISYYHARLRRGIPTPPLREWLESIHSLRLDDDMTEIHTRPQSAYLGPDPSRYDIVLPLHRLAALPGLLSERIGDGLPPMSHANKNDSYPVDADVQRLANAYAAHDRVLRWNGATEIIAPFSNQTNATNTQTH